MPISDPEKRREYARLWIAKRRAEFFANKTCIDCGSTDRLELDHVDPKTKIDHKIWSWTAARRDQETAKCVVRCHECHVKKTVKFDLTASEHGHKQRYERHGCRCDLCRSWVNAKNKRTRNRRNARLVQLAE